MTHSNCFIFKDLGIVVFVVGFIFLAGCQPAVVEEPEVLMEPVFFPSPPSKPRIQFLKSFSGPEDIGVEGPSFLETFIVGEPEEDEFIVKAYGGAIYNGIIYICDVGLRQIAVLDIQNKSFSHYSLDSRLILPFNIFIDTDGTKYITDPEGGAVFVHNDKDELIRILGMGLKINPRDAFVQGDNIYITDNKNRQVVVLNKTTGELIRKIGRPASRESAVDLIFDDDEFGLISDLTLDSQGNIYVTDILRSQIIKFDPFGEFIRTYSGIGQTAAHLLRPKGVAIDKADRIWVADAGPAEAVKIYNQEGQLLMFFGTHGREPGKMFMPAKVIIDYDHVELFQSYVVEGAELECLVLVTNQFGPHKISVYGFGTFPEMAASEEIRNEEELKTTSSEVIKSGAVSKGIER